MLSSYYSFVWPTVWLFSAVFWVTAVYIIYSNFGVGVLQFIAAMLAGYTSTFLACLTTAFIFVSIDWAVAGWRKVRQA